MAADYLVGTMLGRFRVIDRLGGGGMGFVYRAEDTRLGRQVALKIMRPELAADAEGRARFLREARSAAVIAHPSVATVYDVGEQEGLAFIAMELVEGGSLRAFLDQNPPSIRSLTIALDVAAGLARAHQVGVIHRDLKPENVVITQDGLAKILDFGLAKLGTSETGRPAAPATMETEAGRVMGTPGYMSPEQARGETVAATSDVFSFGVMLHELLSGQRPFRGGDVASVLAALLRDPPAPLPDSVPAPLASIVRQCLEKDPALRFPDGTALYAALRVVARPLMGDLLRPPSASDFDAVPAAQVPAAIVGASATGRRSAAPPPAGEPAPRPRPQAVLTSTLAAAPAVSPDATTELAAATAVSPDAATELAAAPAVSPDAATELAVAAIAGLSAVGAAPVRHGSEVAAALGKSAVPVDGLPAKTGRAARSRDRRRVRWLATALAIGSLALAGFLLAGADRARHGTPAHPRTLPAAASNQAPPLTLRQEPLSVAGGNRVVRRAAIGPDGVRYAAVDDLGLHVARVDGGGERRDLASPEEASVDSIAWYPDGSALMVGACVNGGCSLYRIPVDGQPSSQWRARAMHGAVSPDGRHVVFQDPARGDALVAPTEGGPAQSLGPWTLSGRCLPSWAPDSRAVALTAWGDSANAPASVILVGLDGSARTVYRSNRLKNSATLSCAVFLPSGDLLLALTDQVDGAPGTALARLAVAGSPSGGNPTSVAVLRRREVQSFTVSADGVTLLALEGEPQTDIEVAPLLDGGRRLGDAVRLTPDDANDRLGEWIDARTLVFASDRDGPYAVYAQAMDAPTARRIWAATDAAATYPTAMQGGREILFWRTVLPRGEEQSVGASALWRVPIVGGPARVAFDFGMTVDLPLTGAPAPRTLRAACARTRERCVIEIDEGRQLTFHALDAGAADTKPLLSFARAPTVFLTSWSLAPDGARIAVTEGDVLHVLDLERGTDVPIRLPSTYTIQYTGWDRSGALFATGTNDTVHEQQLLRIEPSGAITVLASSARRWFAHPAVSPDGSHLAYVTKRTDLQLYRATLPRP